MDLLFFSKIRTAVPILRMFPQEFLFCSYSTNVSTGVLICRSKSTNVSTGVLRFIAC